MRFCLRTLAGLMAIAWVLPVVVGQPPGPGASGPSAPVKAQPAKAQLAVKVFKLERGDPEVVVQALHALLESPDAELVPAAPPAGPVPMGMGVAPPVGPPGGFGGSPAPPVGVQGFGALPPGGAIGCFFGNGGSGAPPVWRAVAQERTRAVIVRGSDRHLKVAADLVSVLDRPAGAPLPKLQVVTAFALKHATAEELADVVSALSFEDAKVATPDARVLALVAPADVAKSVAELVKELDVPSTGEPRPRPEPKKGAKPKEGKSPS